LLALFLLLSIIRWSCQRILPWGNVAYTARKVVLATRRNQRAAFAFCFAKRRLSRST
jgi:hypothetical protein